MLLLGDRYISGRQKTWRLEEIKIKKGQIIQSEGEFNSKIYQVKSGLLRSFAIDKNGKENIFMFAPEGWIIADTCAPESKTELFIDALEDSVIIVFKKDIEREKQNVSAITKRLNVLQKRVLMLISSNAIERYEQFIEAYPDIVQRVPQHMIASYIGVNPKTLSAAKSKRLNK